MSNIIQGHVGRNTSGGYGDAWIEDAKREISKIPAYRIEPEQASTFAPMEARR